MDTVHIFDTTLRDGEQSPGFSMHREEKLRLARQLEQLGVDVIEAGFPIASPGDLEAVRAVAGEIRGCRVAALARAKQDDVDAALRALEPAAKPRLHIFLATSDLHLKHKLRMERHEALEQVRQMVRFGVEHTEEVEFSAEDASRSDIEYLCDVAEAAAEAGATIINLPDTVGYSTPDEYGEMFRTVRRRLTAYPEYCLQRALPQRSRACGCKFAGRDLCRRAAGGMHDQWNRRARWQRFARRNCGGAARPAEPLLRCHEYPPRKNLFHQPVADGDYGRIGAAE